MVLGLVLLSVLLFIILLLSLIYIGYTKFTSFKELFVCDEKLKSRDRVIKKLKRKLETKEEEIDKYSEGLNDSVDKMDELVVALEERDKIINSFDEVAVNMDEFYKHIKAVGELKLYYGDQTISELLSHTKYIMSYIEDFKGGVLTHETKEEDRNGEKPHYRNAAGETGSKDEKARTYEEGETSQGEGEEVLD